MPEAQQKIDLGPLDRRLTELQKNLTFVGQSNQTQTSELYQIIHRPGWTTVLQVELAGQILDAMTQQANALRALRATLETHVKESAAQATHG